MSYLDSPTYKQGALEVPESGCDQSPRSRGARDGGPSASWGTCSYKLVITQIHRSFLKWGYPQIIHFSGNSFINHQSSGTPIYGNLQIQRSTSSTDNESWDYFFQQALRFETVQVAEFNAPGTWHDQRTTLSSTNISRKTLEREQKEMWTAGPSNLFLLQCSKCIK